MLTDTQARKIASEWHGGGRSALYTLCSTGAIIDAVYLEIHRCELASDNIQEDFDALENLTVYCSFHGIRGPQEGWSSLTW